MYELFTDRARKVLQLANQEARLLNHEYIGTEHLLLGLLKESSGIASHVLNNLGLTLAKAKEIMGTLVEPGSVPVTVDKLPQTPNVKKCIEGAIVAARTIGHNYVGTEHLLLGLAHEEDGVAARTFKLVGIHRDTIRDEVLNLLGVQTKQPTGKEPEIKKDSEAATSLMLLIEGAALRHITNDWLTRWVGDRHTCNKKDTCHTCECWGAYDSIFKHVP